MYVLGGTINLRVVEAQKGYTSYCASVCLQWRPQAALAVHCGAYADTYNVSYTSHCLRR